MCFAEWWLVDDWSPCSEPNLFTKQQLPMGWQNNLERALLQMASVTGFLRNVNDIKTLIIRSLNWCSVNSIDLGRFESFESDCTKLHVQLDLFLHTFTLQLMSHLRYIWSLISGRDSPLLQKKKNRSNVHTRVDGTAKLFVTFETFLFCHSSFSVIDFRFYRFYRITREQKKSSSEMLPPLGSEPRH